MEQLHRRGTMRLSISNKISSASGSNVICFALPGNQVDDTVPSRYRLLKFDSYLEYAKSRPDTFCFVIGTDNINKGCKLIKNLRADPASSIKPIYLLKSLSDRVDPMTDGVVSSIREAYERGTEMVNRLLELDSDSLIGPENDTYRVLGYMYSRPDACLEPHGHWRNKRFYAFPVLNAMFDHVDDSALLQNLLDRKLVEPLRLMDRLRHCSQCDGTHLNYIDICPNCADIDIVQVPFLHCFTCGHVAPEEQYVSQSVLACPKCAARLRHIGVDYDRPLENYQCKGCRHVFIEPAISVRCMHCHTPSAPDELIPRSVYTYQLTEKGRTSARTGAVEDVFGLIDNLNNTTVSYFESILDWLLSLCRRHHEEQFSLVGVRIRNVVELTDRIGRHKVRALMDEFARRVHELIRSTDLATRMNQYTLWLLLPKTDVQGNAVVLDRIRLLKSDDPSGLSLSTTSYHAPSQMIERETAKLLLARLEGMITE
jgi:GGDEF domain-containing protein